MRAPAATLALPLLTVLVLGAASAPAESPPAWREKVDAALLAEYDAGTTPLRFIAMTSGPSEAVASSAVGLGARVIYAYEIIPAFAGSLPAAMLPSLAGLAGVTSVWPDAETRALDAPSRQDIGVPAVEALGFNGNGVRIAYLDTGVNPLANSLPSGKVAICVTFMLGVRTPTCLDNHGHGTHTASTGSGVATTPSPGVATASSVAAYKVLNDLGSGFVSDGIAALGEIIATAATNQIRVISMSLGTTGGNGQSPFSLASNAAWNAGFVVVVSAGNDGPAAMTIGSPGDALKVITVGAVSYGAVNNNQDDVIAGFSSRGPTTDGRIKPEIVAPGVGISASCAPGFFACTFSGTSMAAPHVSGVAALVLQKHPTWTPDQVRNALLSTAVKQNADGGPTPNNNYGFGLVWGPGAIAL